MLGRGDEQTAPVNNGYTLPKSVRGDTLRAGVLMSSGLSLWVLTTSEAQDVALE
jgi:hypothetical protein